MFEPVGGVDVKVIVFASASIAYATVGSCNTPSIATSYIVSPSKLMPELNVKLALPAPVNVVLTDSVDEPLTVLETVVST